MQAAKDGDSKSELEEPKVTEASTTAERSGKRVRFTDDECKLQPLKKRQKPEDIVPMETRKYIARLMKPGSAPPRSKKDKKMMSHIRKMKEFFKCHDKLPSWRKIMKMCHVSFPIAKRVIQHVAYQLGKTVNYISEYMFHAFIYYAFIQEVYKTHKINRMNTVSVYAL